MFIMQQHPKDILSALRVWLYSIACLIFAMVVIGGATRLTGSGLSITEWQPILGAIPPLSSKAWDQAFMKYKLIPQYRLINADMNLDSFKAIFWWEWGHRFLGRFIGLIFVAGLAWFAFTKRLTRSLCVKLFGILLLGGAQGALGWFMVVSGLSDRVSVSHYRLMAHLLLALFLYLAVLWVAFGLHSCRHNKYDRFGMCLLFGIIVQIAAGALVAGLDAGQGYDSWPLMEGALIPNGLFVSGWRDLFDNAMTVQFSHRLLAYGLAIGAFAYLLYYRDVPALLFLSAIIIQIFLGILTLLFAVPLLLALLHQACAMILVTVILWNIDWRMKRGFA